MRVLELKDILGKKYSIEDFPKLKETTSMEIFGGLEI